MIFLVQKKTKGAGGAGENVKEIKLLHTASSNGPITDDKFFIIKLLILLLFLFFLFCLILVVLSNLEWFSFFWEYLAIE